MAQSDKELEEMEKGWDIWQEVLESVGEIQAGKGKKVSMTRPAAARVRKASGLSQAESIAEFLNCYTYIFTFPRLMVSHLE